ncbi:MAG: alanine racemase [Chloroflexota bacterium]
MAVSPEYSTWVEINLDAIRNNVRWVRHYTSTQVMAIVKADAYGHGAVPVARAALQSGATWLGVARIEEALELRAAEISAPILLLGYISPQRIKLAIQNDVSFTVWLPEQIKTINQTAQALNQSAKVHLKVDTGMSRIGVQVDDALDLARQIAHADRLSLEGVYTHFARADESDSRPTEHQLELFLQSLKSISPYLTSTTLIHASNSAAAIGRKDSLFHLVRLGIAMYGLNPFHDRPMPAGFLPALSWKTVLSHVKVLEAGRGVSYGHVYTTKKTERIGTIPVGYADGYRRWPGNMVLVQGRKVPVVGRVCMDQCMLQLDSVPRAVCGDEVVLIGSQGEERISAEDLARVWQTINYEVVCGIGKRVPRLYLEAGSPLQ